MSSHTLALHLENHPHHMMDNVSEPAISIDQGGEWDISLFDELDYLGDADDLLAALGNAGYAAEGPDLDFDMDLPPWNGADAGRSCTDFEAMSPAHTLSSAPSLSPVHTLSSAPSLSPAHTLSSVPSPASVEALSPYSLSDESLSPQSQPSPVSVCSESSGFSEAPPPPRREAPPPAKRAPKRSSQARAKPAQPVRRPIQLGPTKVLIQPKPVLTVPFGQAAAKAIIIQPLHATVLPAVKPAPVSIQPAPPPGRPVLLSQPGQVLQIQTQQTLTGHVLTMPPLSAQPVSAPSMVSVSLRASSSDDESKVSQRQQRMIKNRESASLSRKKKKEYLLTLEARLKVALSENEVLKHENGHLKRQLEGMLTENTGLKTTTHKRRAVCLMVVLVFLMLNVGPMSLFQGSRLQAGSIQHNGRHLLGFSPETDAEARGEVGPGPRSRDPPQMADSVEDKALMVVKDPIFLSPPPPCQPPVNRTKCMELAHELRGWVHRHEVEQTKTRRMSNSHHKPTRTILKTEKEANNAQIVTVQYTDSTDEKNPGSELQVYYASHRTYNDFFDEIHRRGDTFYVVSFHRDHLLLPATSHNKGSRPKMSVVLPAVNLNESIIRDQDFEVMMQIDCEVTDTRILHIKSSTIPPLLRANRTHTVFQPNPSASQATPPVGVLVGSA